MRMSSLIATVVESISLLGSKNKEKECKLNLEDQLNLKH